MRKHSHPITQRTKNNRSRIRMQRMHARPMHWLQNALLVGCVLAVLGILTFFTISSVSAQSIHQLSAAKQQLEQSQVQWHASVDKKKAPKGIVSTHSCLVNLQHAPVITSPTHAQMITMHNAYASFASVVSAENKPYFIFGENSKFVVQAVPLDPCKADPAYQIASKQTFEDPLQQGYLTITSVHGDLVSYRAVSGVAGAFNYVTGQFQ
jgi:hypothetical protein